MNQKGFANLFLIIVVIVLLGAAGYFVFIKKSQPLTQQLPPTSTQAANQTKAPNSLTPVEAISPDGTLVAIITSNSTQESKIVIQEKENSRILSSVDLSSPDGEHGQVINQKSWTLDSQFFVFNAYSSGGHQPMFNPTFIFNRTKQGIYDLNKFLSPNGQVSGPFELAGDKIKLQEWVYAEQKHRTITLDILTLSFAKYTPLKLYPDKQ